MDPETTVGPLITAAHCEKVHTFLQRAVSDGVTLVTGGTALSGGAFEQRHFDAPTLLVDVTGAIEIAREEVFGPGFVLCPSIRSRQRWHSLTTWSMD